MILVLVFHLKRIWHLIFMDLVVFQNGFDFLFSRKDFYLNCLTGNVYRQFTAVVFLLIFRLLSRVFVYRNLDPQPQESNERSVTKRPLHAFSILFLYFALNFAIYENQKV